MQNNAADYNAFYKSNDVLYIKIMGLYEAKLVFYVYFYNINNVQRNSPYNIYGYYHGFCKINYYAITIVFICVNDSID